jgi:thiamine-monophosphate kinase
MEMRGVDVHAGLSDYSGTPMGETEFIDWIRARVEADKRVSIGPGDDAAALDFPAAARCLISTDMLLDGTCFRLDEAGPYRVGRKAVSVNISDIAAMAGVPLAIVIAVGLPRSGSMELAQQLFKGMEEAAKENDVAVIGGDTNTWQGPLTISATVLGEATDRGPVTRSGAKPGDWIFVTGPLGGSILGHHLDFRPRVREALELHRIVGLHALTDISDGFALDLFHITRESRCGAVTFAHQVPISDAAQRMNDRLPPLDHALCDGEDYELIFTVSASDGKRLVDEPQAASFPVFHVGECVEHGFWIDDGSSRRPLEPRGYEHSWQ